MASTLQATGKKAFLDGGVALLTDTIKVALINNSYTYSSAHDFYDDVSANVIGTDQTLGTKDTTGGVFDAADPTWTAVAGGSTVQGFWIYKDTGTPATSTLIFWSDTYTNLPFATNGGDITIQFDSGANKIFAL